MWAAAPGCAQQLQGAPHLPWTVPAAVLTACGAARHSRHHRQSRRRGSHACLSTFISDYYLCHAAPLLSMQASHPCAAPATACGWRHAAACRSRRPARTPLPPRAAGKKQEHDLHNLSNVDASQMQSDPGDLGR